MSERENFERFAKPLYDGLKEAESQIAEGETGFQWLVRTRKPEFFIWNAQAVAHVQYVIGRNGDEWLFVFLSNGAEQVSQVPDAVVDIVVTALGVKNADAGRVN